VLGAVAEQTPALRPKAADDFGPVRLDGRHRPVTALRPYRRIYRSLQCRPAGGKRPRRRAVASCVDSALNFRRAVLATTPVAKTKEKCTVAVTVTRDPVTRPCGSGPRANGLAKGDEGRASGTPEPCDGSALSKTRNWRMFASEPEPIRAILS
jgi:hypothetical protein